MVNKLEGQEGKDMVKYAGYRYKDNMLKGESSV